MAELFSPDDALLVSTAALYRDTDASFAHWAAGYGVVQHQPQTQVRIYELADRLVLRGIMSDRAKIFQMLAAADRIANAAMWLTVHMTYAKRVKIDGRELEPGDFKKSPEGHTGGALNMVPAYVGYLLANALSGTTRSWLMGQGHCVAAIDSTNLIVDNMSPAHAERYSYSEEGLTRFVNDFYSYRVLPNGRPESPLGSHVNAHTAGGMIEGGYLGFAELYYVHMPLPGEELVAFLSDGAFEEQRGSDFVPRWWRPGDSGAVVPVMIANGRRIDQRTTMSQVGGVHWFRDHLRLNGFDPIDIDGRDPAAFAWSILHVSEELAAVRDAALKQDVDFPCKLPYVIAETEKGYGFPGAGTNAAHNLPLEKNPATDDGARKLFQDGARALWVSPEELQAAAGLLNNHVLQHRVKERNHALSRRRPEVSVVPEIPYAEPNTSNLVIPMDGIDQYFCEMVQSNLHLRPRVGNPDELSSNRMLRTLHLLKHRVTSPESSEVEDIEGGIITALNEEAVVSAALANKAGLNIVVSYEAFAVKMLGAIRQELIFSRHQRESGQAPGWLSVPIVLSSHTWENGKNEQSHQDPTLCEALLAEMSDVSRVIFPADRNSAMASLRACYLSRGEIWTMVVAKRALPVMLSATQAEDLSRVGAVKLRSDDGSEVQLVAIGSYQLIETLRASRRLDERGVAHDVVYILEPGRFREPRDEMESVALASPAERTSLFPVEPTPRVIVVHGHPEVFLGVLRPLDCGPAKTSALGYINRGGTLDVFGMLFANRCTWAHILVEAARVTRRDAVEVLSEEELGAVCGQGNPDRLR